MSTLAFFRGQLAQERGIFNRVAGAVLEDGLEYRPDPKARCSRELLEHLIGHNLDLAELIDDGVIHHRQQVPFHSLEDGLARLDESCGVALDKLAGMDDEGWAEPARFLVGEHVVMEGSREQLAWVLLLDAIHHRGQLSTHLRPTGSKVPAMYGPSADEQMMAH